MDNVTKEDLKDAQEATAPVSTLQEGLATIPTLQVAIEDLRREVDGFRRTFPDIVRTIVVESEERITGTILRLFYPPESQRQEQLLREEQMRRQRHKERRLRRRQEPLENTVASHDERIGHERLDQTRDRMQCNSTRRRRA